MHDITFCQASCCRDKNKCLRWLHHPDNSDYIKSGEMISIAAFSTDENGDLWEKGECPHMIKDDK